MLHAVGWRSCKLSNLVSTTLPTAGHKLQQCQCRLRAHSILSYWFAATQTHGCSLCSWKVGLTTLSVGVALPFSASSGTRLRQHPCVKASSKCSAVGACEDIAEVHNPVVQECPRQHRIKKKVAFWVGYVGTEYRGLQLQRSPEIATVEAELEKAILKADGMLASNFGNLHRLGWARSSRTDKGVHSISTVISMKMEVPESAWVHDEDGVALAESINAHLPPTIRVFSVVPVPKSFDSRKMCYTRTYEYLLPAGVLSQGVDSVAAAEGQIAELNSILSEFQGRHPFHNYTVRSRYQNMGSKPAYRSRVSAFQSADGSVPQYSSEVASDRLSEDEDLSFGADKEILDPTGEEELEDDFHGSDESVALKARWIYEPDGKDKVRNAHFRHILSCSCSNVIETSGNAHFLKISITGESFMLHQIRKIVGTSVAVLWGVLPRDLIPLTLARHSRIVLPLAPSEGLVLADNQFHNFKLPSSYARSASTTLKADGEPRLEPSDRVKNEMRSFSKNVLLPSVTPLLDHAGPVWATWVENVTTQAQIPDVEIKAVQEAFGRWLERSHVHVGSRKVET